MLLPCDAIFFRCPGADMGPSFLEPFEPLPISSSSTSCLLPISETETAGRSSLDSHNQQSEEVARLTELVLSLQNEIELNKLNMDSCQSQAPPSTSEANTHCDENLTATNSELQTRLDEALVQIEELTYQKDDLEERLEMEMGANQETEQEFDQIKSELNAEITRLNELVSAKDSENVRLQTELNEANVTLHGQLEFSLMEEAADMKSKVETMTQEKKYLEDELATKSSKIVELIAFVTAAKDSIGQLESDLATERKEAVQQKSVLETTLSDMQNKLKSVTTEMGAWMTECEKQISAAGSMGERATALESDKARLTELLVAAEAQACIHLASSEEASKQVQELSEQVATLLSKAEAGEQSVVEREQALQAQQEAHAEELDGVFKELEAAEESIEQLQQDKTSAQELIAGLQEELDGLKTQLKAHVEDKSEVQSVLYDQTNELKALQAQVSEMTEKMTEHDTLLEKTTSLEEQVIALEAAKTEIQANLDATVIELDSLQSTLQNTEEELMGVSSDIIMRENEVDALSAEVNELKESHAVAAEAAAAQIEELQNEVTRLTEVLTANQALDSSAQEELKTLKSQLASENDSIVSLKSEFQTIHTSYTEKLSSLQAQLDEKEQQLIETLQLLEEVSPSTNVSDEDHLLLKEEFLSTQAKLEEVSLEIESLNEQVADLNIEVTAQASQLEESAAQLESANTLVNELTEFKTTSCAQIEALTQEIATLKEEHQMLNEVEGDLSGADDLICELQLKVATLEKDLSDSALERNVLEQSHSVELDSASQQLEAAQESIERLQQDKISADETISSLQEELVVLKTQLEGDAEISKQELATLQAKLEETEEELLGVSSDMLQREADIETLSAELEQVRSAANIASTEGSDAHSVELSNIQLAANHTISSLQQKVSDLEIQLCTASQAAIGTADEYDHHQKDFSTEIQKLNSILGQKDGEISKLMAEVANLSERTATAEASLSMSIQQGNVADMDVDAQAKRSRQLQTQVDLLQSEKDSLVLKVTEIDSERKRIEHAAADVEYKLVGEVESLKAQVLKLGEASQSAIAQHQALEAMEKTLGLTSAELVAVKELHQNALTTISSLEITNSSLKDKMRSFEDALQQQSQMDQLQADKNELQEKLDEAIVQQSELENRIKRSKNDLTAMTDEVNRQEEQRLVLIQERDSLLQTVQTLQLEAQEVKELSSVEAATAINDEQIAAYEEEISVLAGSVTVLEEDNAAMSQALSEMKAELEGVTAECREYASKSDQDAASISDLTLQLNAALEKEGALSAQFSDERAQLEGRVTTLQQELETVLVGASEKRAQQIVHIEQLENEIAQKDKEISLLTETVSASAADSSSSSESQEHLQLISEMNTLMEEKMEAESKIQSAEMESKQLRLQLSDYDKKSSKEVSLMMEAAQAEMDFLKSTFDKERAEGILQIKTLRESVLALEEEVANATANAAASAANNTNSAELEAELDEVIGSRNMLQLQHDEALQSLRELQKEHKHLQKKYTNFKSEMEELIVAKDKRIARLDASKLTTEQLQRINEVRAESKQKTSECKMYKKQLKDLKDAYETLQKTVSERESSSSRTTRASAKEASSSVAELSAVKLQLAEVTSQLEQANFVSKTLKDKLKDCSKQLQQYEQERQDIIHILQDCHIDVAGLMLNDESNVDESVLDEQELSEPVGKLAEKWQQAHTLSTTLKSQMLDTEDRFLSLSTDVESSRTQKMALEKKLESTKNALKTAKAEQDELLAQLETARHQMTEVKAELLAAKSSISGSEDAISTEIQVLEEENIELLRENKELRIASATYRAKAEALSRQVGTSVVSEDSAGTTVSSESKKRPVEVLEVETTPSQPGGIKKVKENDENASVVGKTQKQAATSSSARSFGTALDENTLHTAPSSTAQITSSVQKPAPVVGGGRRGRRVVTKAVANTNNCGESTEQPGECTQS